MTIDWRGIRRLKPHVTEADIAEVLAKNQSRQITAHGVERCGANIGGAHDNCQAALLADVDGVQIARDWLLNRPRAKGSSYTLKHLVEHDCPGMFVSNGALIVGAILAGRKLGWTAGGDCLVNPTVAAAPSQRSA